MPKSTLSKSLVVEIFPNQGIKNIKFTILLPNYLYMHPDYLYMHPNFLFVLSHYISCLHLQFLFLPHYKRDFFDSFFKKFNLLKKFLENIFIKKVLCRVFLKKVWNNEPSLDLLLAYWVRESYNLVFFKCMLFHVACAFHSGSTLNSCLNIKKQARGNSLLETGAISKV